MGGSVAGQPFGERLGAAATSGRTRASKLPRRRAAASGVKRSRARSASAGRPVQASERPTEAAQPGPESAAGQPVEAPSRHRLENDEVARGHGGRRTRGVAMPPRSADPARRQRPGGRVRRLLVVRVHLGVADRRAVGPSVQRERGRLLGHVGRPARCPSSRRRRRRRGRRALVHQPGQAGELAVVREHPRHRVELPVEARRLGRPPTCPRAVADRGGQPAGRSAVAIRVDTRCVAVRRRALGAARAGSRPRRYFVRTRSRQSDRCAGQVRRAARGAGPPSRPRRAGRRGSGSTGRAPDRSGRAIRPPRRGRLQPSPPYGVGCSARPGPAPTRCPS